MVVIAHSTFIFQFDLDSHDICDLKAFNYHIASLAVLVWCLLWECSDSKITHTHHMLMVLY